MSPSLDLKGKGIDWLSPGWPLIPTPNSMASTATFHHIPGWWERLLSWSWKKKHFHPKSFYDKDPELEVCIGWQASRGRGLGRGRVLSSWVSHSLKTTGKGSFLWWPGLNQQSSRKFKWQGKMCTLHSLCIPDPHALRERERVCGKTHPEFPQARAVQRQGH